MNVESLFSGSVLTQVRIAPQAQLGSALAANNGQVDWSPRELYYDLQLQTNNRRPVLEIKLTDRLDPLFIWQATVSEDDYFLLRREQQLLVDYQRFPHRMADFLRQCQAATTARYETFANRGI